MNFPLKIEQESPLLEDDALIARILDAAARATELGRGCSLERATADSPTRQAF